MSLALGVFHGRPWAMRYLSVIIAISALAPGVQANSCSRALVSILKPLRPSAPQAPRSLTEIPELRFGTYNTYNLMQSADGASIKSDLKRHGVAAPILEHDLDIVVLQEVENLNAIKSFSEKYLKDRYDVLLSTGNDARGIQVAFLVKKDLPFRIKLDTHVDARAIYPVTGQETAIFSRDLPAIRLWENSQNPETEDPLVVFYGTHFKSKRDKDGDPESRILRRVQVETAASIIRDDKKKHPSSFVMLAGDFNGDVRTDPEFEPLRSFMVDAFEAQATTPLDAERITHSFHPHDAPATYSQIDAFFVAPENSALVTETFVHRYKNEAGEIKPVPRSWDERDLNPSDHFPVILKIELQTISRRA